VIVGGRGGVVGHQRSEREVRGKLDWRKRAQRRGSPRGGDGGGGGPNFGGFSGAPAVSHGQEARGGERVSLECDLRRGEAVWGGAVVGPGSVRCHAEEPGGGSGPVPGGACRRWGSWASPGAAEVGVVRQRARQGSGERKGDRAHGPLWAGWRGRPKMNSGAL
jgi:hypothetical protein